MPSFTPVQKEQLDRILVRVSQDFPALCSSEQTEAVASKKIPASSFIVTDVHGVLYEQHLGNAVFDDPSSKPIDADALAWLCSQTKLVTTVRRFFVPKPSRY